MLNARFQECPSCGGRTVLETERELILSVSGTMHTDIDLLSPSFMPRALHAAAVLMFGGCRLACCECGARFSSRGEGRSGSNDGIATTEPEVHLLND